ncbi:type IV pilus biogenesis/stability protein PilW [Noviherbaspirillum massiliense]|uniref:type IV pilus biogenesis/stability protein PilW n=1 Tax=Noviherbaspirillum massiliense TaxID=1465823 RepID=UPI000379DD44|nr:type IV pilus biogenesis/stability protein PilW [Noviherbaspirillum massiliense]
MAVAAVCSFVLLGGCASYPSAGSQGELKTSSDQTENQKLARIRLRLAVGYYEQHQLEIALDEVKKALQADPDSADAHSMRGLIYMDMGENRLAEESFQQALKLMPNNPDFNNNYGWFLCQTGRERQSIDYFEAVLKNRAYQSPAKALNNAGVCSLKLKNMAAAEQYLSRAFQLDPANSVTNTNLAKIYYERRDYERARFYINRVLKSEIMTPEVLWLAIRTAHKQGDGLTETSLATQLRRRHPNSREYATYQRGAFDE